jgi:NADPH-dependent 2,4-dienoyl-CoA reductase/sulfur reductase-like enzyme
MARFRGNWDTGERRNLRRILVVGAGRAGVAAAEELRRQGFGGEITVLCDEQDAPYDRPSCSKGLLNGNKRPKDAKMPVQDDLAIQWALGRKATYLDVENRAVVADTNEEFRYDGLVIATGARPLWPKGWPPKGEPGLHGLHGMSDAWELRRSLHRARRVAVVGGGLTGCEVACTVRTMARDCVLVDSKPQVMARALGEVVGRYVTEEVAKDGVELRLTRRVKRVDRGRKGRGVLVLDDGSEEEADLVVATIGEKPDTRWLADSGFDISDGVLCDEQLRVVGAEDVVACGTVARWPNLRYSTEPRRVGQWIMALEQGRAAAASDFAPTRNRQGGSLY